MDTTALTRHRTASFPLTAIPKMETSALTRHETALLLFPLTAIPKMESSALTRHETASFPVTTIPKMETSTALTRNGTASFPLTVIPKMEISVLTGAMNPQQTEPVPDAIKMFVGQIPRNWDENDLKNMFGEFGPIHSMHILRDKSTGQSKGCCFVTFVTRKDALDAQKALHNIKTLPTMHHPIQMKPADSEKKGREERKLFIGMLSKKFNENVVIIMFVPFGAIEECQVLRDHTGTTSRGCAFVTFGSRVCAQNAIKSMHHSQIMEGCSSPLVVKFADTQREKEHRKAQQMNQNSWNTTNSFGGLGPQYLAQLLQRVTGSNQGDFGSQQSNMGFYMLQLLAAAVAGSNPGALGNFGQLGAGGNAGNMGGARGLGVLEGNMNRFGSNSNSLDALTQAYSGIQQYAASFPNAFNQAAQPQQAANSTAGSKQEGPDSANLFIYHLPQEFGDADLMQMFMPFGNIISAGVFIDKQTNLSKCFGFVRFDNPLATQRAIQSMNGFQIDMKRLKVQLKRPKNESRPY